MSLSPQFLDELRARTTLSALIQRTVPLKRAGREWKACCPFHQEKGPSFHVNDEKAFYHCFGCGAHGDAITWLVENNGLQFMDAVKELAAAAGMDVPASDPRQAARDRELGEMFDIMAQADRWFQTQRGDDALGALRYIAERGLDASKISEFGLGYAPRGRGAPRLLDAMASIDVEKLITLGLVKRREEGERAGEIYDTFRGRLMFPIHDVRGRVIGFGGRIIGQGEPKYLNSPDTPLFDKGRTLYNAHRASPAARKSGRLVIVEGYMDVIAFCRAGVTEVVAPNGTALTEAQISLAWRMADVPILCMDGDKAGKAAMARAAIKALPLLEPGKSLAFVTPPTGQDPDDILREKGAETVQALLEQPRQLVDVLWAHERDAGPTDTPEQVAGLRARLRDHVRSIRSRDVREAYGQAIAKRFRETFDATSEGVTQHQSGPQIRSRPLNERQAFSRPRGPEASQAQKTIRRIGLSAEIERAVLIGLLHFPDLIAMDTFRVFSGPEIRRVAQQLCDNLIMNPVRTEEDLDALLDGTTLEQDIDKATWGGSLPFSFGKPVIRSQDADKARAELIQVLANLPKN